jgi:hypothetical protein
LEKILVQGHFVYHKSQIDLFGIKPVPQSWTPYTSKTSLSVYSQLRTFTQAHLDNSYVLEG